MQTLNVPETACLFVRCTAIIRLRSIRFRSRVCHMGGLRCLNFICFRPLTLLLMPISQTQEILIPSSCHEKPIRMLRSGQLVVYQEL